MDQYSLFFLIAILATVISLLLAISALKLRSPGSGAFMWMMFAVSLWTGSIAAGMRAPNHETAFLWTMVRMVGVILSPVAWFFLVIRYTERPFLSSRRNIILVLIIPVLSIILYLTNNYHHWFVEQIHYLQVRAFLIDETWDLGPYFTIHVLYSYSLIVIGDLILLREAVQIADRFRRQAIAIVLATVIPLLINLSYITHFIPSLKVNYDPLGFVLTGLILGWGIFFNELFDLSPIARNILVDNMVDGMIVINSKEQIVDLNPAAENILLVDKNVIGTPINTLLLDHVLPPLSALIPSERYHYEKKRENGEQLFYELQVSSIYGHQASRGKLLTIRNVTEQKLVEKQLQEIAITDALTGLANHRHFYDLLNQEEERSKRTGKPFSLLMFDIDHFKKVNDTHGHLVGDQVLRQIAVIGKESLRSYDRLCRYGGEEFAAILPESGLDSACATAERLRKAVHAHDFNLDGLSLKLTISLGISAYDPNKPLALLALVDSADKAVYHSKANGRNLATCWRVNEFEIIR
jgi:diguanylate cyclase (GGDEF)-like protein/PAS domain S-box-containing protein